MADKNKVFYGEYSLEHWMKLILTKNIILPEYQRKFVWDEEQVLKLVDTLKNDLFIPPITIGCHTVNDETKNLILDGQQRLTSVLLAYLNIYPNKDKFRSHSNSDEFANENDDLSDENSFEVLDWTFREITDISHSKSAIIEKLKNSVYTEKYKTLKLDLSNGFFREKYLGFSFVVPHKDESQSQQYYFSSVFRSINQSGKPLSKQESRKSLYFLDDKKQEFFEPEFIKNYKIKLQSKIETVDIVRIFSFLSQFKKEQSSSKVAKGYPQKIIEDYYALYIYDVVNDSAQSIFTKFSDTFPDGQFTDRFTKWKKVAEDLNIQREFKSIIESDIYLFGLTYLVIFENKSLDYERVDQLKTRLTEVYSRIKNNKKHSKSPAQLGHLRERLKVSVNTYKEFVTDETA